jgi:hypothetical protein
MKLGSDLPPPGQMLDHLETHRAADSKPGQAPAPEGAVPSATYATHLGDLNKNLSLIAAKSPKFSAWRSLAPSFNDSKELRPAAADGKVTVLPMTHNNALHEMLEAHQGRVVFREPNGSPRYLFYRHPEGRWEGFSNLGRALPISSPADMLHDLIEKAPPGLLFTAYALSPLGIRIPGSPTATQDVGVDIPDSEKDKSEGEDNVSHKTPVRAKL